MSKKIVIHYDFRSENIISACGICVDTISTTPDKEMVSCKKCIKIAKIETTEMVTVSKDHLESREREIKSLSGELEISMKLSNERLKWIDARNETITNRDLTITILHEEFSDLESCLKLERSSNLDKNEQLAVYFIKTEEAVSKIKHYEELFKNLITMGVNNG